MPKFASAVLGLLATLLMFAGPAVAEQQVAGPVSTSGPAGSVAAVDPVSPAGAVTFGLQPASPSAVTGASVVAVGAADPRPDTAVQADQRPYFYYGVSPGSVITDYVALTNYSSQPIHLRVYSTDSVNTTDGGFALLNANQKPVDAGAWTSVGARATGSGAGLSVVVPARTVSSSGAQVVGRLIEPIRLTVPTDASPGDHVGGIVASLDTLSGATTGPKIQLDQRVATRLFLRVSGPLRPALLISNLTVHYRGTNNPIGTGVATVTYIVRNTGNVKLSGHQRVVLTGPLGITRSSSTPADLPLLVPGGTASTTAVLTGVRGLGSLSASAQIVATSLPGDADPAIPTITAKAKLIVTPWPTIGALLGLVLLVVLWQLRARRVKIGRHQRSERGGPQRVPRHHQPAVRHLKSPSRSHQPAIGRRRTRQLPTTLSVSAVKEHS